MGKAVAKILGMDPTPPPDPRDAQGQAERTGARTAQVVAAAERRKRGRASNILTDLSSQVSKQRLGE